MKKSLLYGLLMVVVVFSVFPATSVFVQDSLIPQASCPTGFMLMEMEEDHEHSGGDHHIGLSEDLNGDGSLCMMELASGLHVHLDNVVR